MEYGEVFALVMQGLAIINQMVKDKREQTTADETRMLNDALARQKETRSEWDSLPGGVNAAPVAAVPVAPAVTASGPVVAATGEHPLHHNPYAGT